LIDTFNTYSNTLSQTIFHFIFIFNKLKNFKHILRLFRLRIIYTPSDMCCDIHGLTESIDYLCNLTCFESSGRFAAKLSVARERGIPPPGEKLVYQNTVHPRLQWSAAYAPPLQRIGLFREAINAAFKWSDEGKREM